MEFSVREFIREIKNSVNARLDMLESLINSKSVDKVDILNNKIQDLEAKVNELMNSKQEELPSIIINDNVYSKFIHTPLNKSNIHESEEDYCEECGRECDGAHGASGDKALEQMAERGLTVINNKIVKLDISKLEEEEEEEEEQEEEVEEQIEEVEEQEEEVEEQVEEHVEEQEEEQEEEVEEQEEEQEEEALTEFEYKGMVLYRDSENKVYQIDDEGELIDTPIGMWNEAKQKVVSIKN